MTKVVLPEAQCDACLQQATTLPVSMPGIPAPFALCWDCLHADSWPYWALVAVVAMATEDRKREPRQAMAQLPPGVRAMVTGTLERQRVPENAFWADVEKVRTDRHLSFDEVKHGYQPTQPEEYDDDDDD